MDISTNAKDLCAKCSSLDIDSILSSPPKTYRGRFILNLGVNEHMNWRCSFCCLLAAVKPQPLNDSNDGLALYSFRILDRLWSLNDENAVLGVLRVVDTKGKGSRDRIEESLQRTGYIASTTQPKFISNSETMTGRVIDRHLVDYAIVRNWLDHCKANHRGCSAKGSQQPDCLKLINCCSRRLEQAPRPCSYIALSYVWGQVSQTGNDRQPQNYVLPRSLPKTIEDTITVTKSLGYEYLWVDKYCINQYDAKDKMDQIQQMDLVYLNAKLTLVAGSGDNSDAGLPGVSSVQRTPQPQARVGKHLLVSLMGDPKCIIMDSTWMSRGWTFQEAVFSRRLLIFTEHQMYFECRSTNFYETVNLTRDWSGWNIFMPNNDQRRFPWYILVRIAEYSKRKFTYQGDVLKAFLGILRLYEKGKHPVYHHWGVPILPPVIKGHNGWPFLVQRSWSDGFLAGLCWKHMTPGHRRVDFPSWSWAGWNVEISETYEEYERGLRVQGENNIEVFFEDRTESILPFEVVSNTPGQNLHLSSYIHLLVYTVQISFQHDPKSAYTQPDYLPCGRKPTLGSIYWATFNITGQVSIQLRLYLLQETNENSDCHTALITNIFTGVVLGDSQFLDATQNTFIMVTQNTGKNFERIGHLILGKGHVRMIHTISGELLDGGLNNQSFEACFWQKKKAADTYRMNYGRAFFREQLLMRSFYDDEHKSHPRTRHAC